MAAARAIALVTGSNRGIGLAVTTLLAETHDVLAVVRKSSEALTTLAGAEDSHVKIIEGIDVTDKEAVSGLSAKVTEALGGGDAKLDVVVNNAGVLTVENLGELAASIDGLRTQMEINAFAPLLVTEALLSVVKDGAKLAFITSRMGSIADNGSGGMYGYRMSKAALNMGVKSLAQDLKPRSIAVAAIHPGQVDTEMTVPFGGGIPREEAAAGIVKRIGEMSLENSGSFWHQNGEDLPW